MDYKKNRYPVVYSSRIMCWSWNTNMWLSIYPSFSIYTTLFFHNTHSKSHPQFYNRKFLFLLVYFCLGFEWMFFFIPLFLHLSFFKLLMLKELHINRMKVLLLLILRCYILIIYSYIHFKEWTVIKYCTNFLIIFIQQLLSKVIFCKFFKINWLLKRTYV